MGILGRYVLREVAIAWLAVTGVLLIILFANEVVAVMERAAANQYPQSVVLELIGLTSLPALALAPLLSSTVQKPRASVLKQRQLTPVGGEGYGFRKTSGFGLSCDEQINGGNKP